MSHPRKILLLFRAGALGIVVVFLFAIVLIQIEQHMLRRRAERLLTDIRSLEIDRASFNDVQDLRRKWWTFAHFGGNCTEDACTLELWWDDFYFRHVELFTRLNVLHSFMLVGGHPQQIKAREWSRTALFQAKGFTPWLEL